MEKEILRVNMLGGFSLCYRDRVVDDNGSRSKKLWMLLEYLITFRDREIPQNELIELLWEDDSNDNPFNTLKALVHRVRRLLDELGLDSKKVVVSRRGAYGWSRDAVITSVDVDDFEQHLLYADAAATEEEKLARLLAAIALYRGDFLPKTALESWAIPISTYYRGKYLKAVKDAVAMLNQSARYEDIIAICQHAVVVDPYEEELHASLIRALADCGRYPEALAHYESATALFYDKFGITPSKEFAALYKEIIKTSNAIEIDLSLIKEGLREKELAKGAFFCEYEIFKEIYQLEARAQLRIGQVVYLALLTVSDAEGNQLSQKQLNAAMDKLRVSVQNSLRQGDAFTRFSVSQYLLMLPGATLENSERVLRRIVENFRRENPRSAAVPRYRLQALDPVQPTLPVNDKPLV